MCAIEMVIPRWRSSGALSIWSNAKVAFSVGNLSCSTFEIAAVRVVLPWSMCPMVPMLTCGLVRSNFAFATVSSCGLVRSRCAGLPRRHWIYQVGRLGLLAARLLDDLLRDGPGDLGVGVELHAVRS